MGRIRLSWVVSGVLAVVAVPILLLAAVPLDLGLLSSDPNAAFSAVTINLGAAFDPHVDGDLASYSDPGVYPFNNQRIRYYNFLTGTDAEIPGNSYEVDQLSDVSNGKIVFARLNNNSFDTAVMLFDSATGTTTEVSPQSPGHEYSLPAIGGNTVAFLELISGELFASQLGGSTVQITADTRFDWAPAVSPLGNVIVYGSCAVDPSDCDIHQAAWDGTAWASTILTNNTEPENDPDTDGVIVVYKATRSGESDIYWQPVGGGAEQRLELPGEQRNPSVSGGLIAFESVAVGQTAADVMVYHIATNRLYGMTSTPSNETLNDVAALPDGKFRVVFNGGTQQTRGVYGVTFTLPSPPTFTFGGFEQPVDPYPSLNVMKAGAAVPVRFSLGGNRGLNIFAAGNPKSAPTICGSSTLETPVDETVSAGSSSLSYDATTDLYSYVWKTDRGWAGTCRQLSILFSDGSIVYANFKFK